ncbi:MAG: phosphatidylserine decarboxylase family protein [Bacteroidetes bacterium]|nr:phosphatidylserine decarboxylase family protein [Bacteroidota bacterium]
MTLHKEGKATITYTLIGIVLVNAASFVLLKNYFPIQVGLFIFTMIFLYIILQFFRSPDRKIFRNEQLIVSPCDGKVVVIEETYEPEYYKEKRLQVSIFMSPFNVHINWYPISGAIKYLKYHTGKYLVAWDPKASTENERSTIVIEKENKFSILVRQIAGALAKRIVYYGNEGLVVKQGTELGFIKFGSRVDIYLPLGTKLHVKIGDKAVGNETVIAEM